MEELKSFSVYDKHIQECEYFHDEDGHCLVDDEIGHHRPTCFICNEAKLDDSECF